MSAIKLDGLTLASTANSAVTLDSEVNFENTYWLQAKVNTSVTCSGTSNPIYFDGSTTPYWVITGDTTNFVQGTNTKDLKFLRKGVYLINISFTGYISGSERAMNLILNGTISGSSVVLARAFDSVTQADSSTTYGNTCISYAGVFNSNDEINVNVYSDSGNNINLHSMTHLNISLIRPLA